MEQALQLAQKSDLVVTAGIAVGGLAAGGHRSRFAGGGAVMPAEQTLHFAAQAMSETFAAARVAAGDDSRGAAGRGATCWRRGGRVVAGEPRCRN